MEKSERRERAVKAQVFLEVAAQAVTQAGQVAGTLTAAEVNRAHDVIGKLQMKLRAVYEKAAP